MPTEIDLDPVTGDLPTSMTERLTALVDLAVDAAGRAEAATVVAMPNVLHDYTHGIPLERLAPPPQPFDFTGTDDSRAKFSTAMASAAGDALPMILPAKSALKITATQPLVPPPAGTRIIGNKTSGGQKPVIFHDEGSYYDRSAKINYDNGFTDLFRLDGAGLLDLTDVSLVGAWGTNPTEGNLRLINGQTQHEGVRLRGVDLGLTRAVALWSVGASVFDTDDTYTYQTMRGGWHVRDPRGRTRITRFSAKWTRDDALHINMVGANGSGLLFPPGGQDVFVDDVTLFGCNGILFSGVKRGILSRVRGKFCTNRLVKIGADHAFGAGDTTSMDLIIRDIIGEDLLAPQDAGSRHNWIELFFLVPAAKTLPSYPGKPGPDGKITQPYGTYFNRDMTDDPAVAAIPGRGIVIENFIGRRTVAAATAFSQYGFGQFFGRDGYVDSPIADATLTPVGMLIAGGCSDLTVRNCAFEGVSDCISWDLVGVPTGTVERVVFDNVKASDIRGNPVDFLNAGGTTQDITFRNCEFDVDPYHVHSSRSPTGGGAWQDVGAGVVWGTQNLYGLRLIGNTVRNAPRLVSNKGNVAESRDNVAYCDPVAMGYNAGNKGVGNLLGYESGWRYVIEGSDPSPAGIADWRRTLNACFDVAPSKPAGSAKWVQGAWVRNASLTNDGIAGWRRLTTGTGNALGVDWMEVKGSAGSNYTTTNSDSTTGYTWGTHGPIINEATVLTSARFRNLVTAGSQPLGAVFEVTRPFGTGGYLLNYRNDTGTVIASLAEGQSARFVWNGTAWAVLGAALPGFAPIVAVTSAGATVSATIPPLPFIIVQDTAPLAQARNLTLTTAPAGTIVHYLNETTGGFTRTLMDGATTLAATSAGQSVRLFSTGTAWKRLA